MSLPCLYPALLEMVTMFCTYTTQAAFRKVYLLPTIVLLAGHVAHTRFIGNKIQENKPERTEQLPCVRYISACYCLRNGVCGGSTGEARPYPPSKAQPLKRRHQHYVAPKKWPIFRFWFWGHVA